MGAEGIMELRRQIPTQPRTAAGYRMKVRRICIAENLYRTGQTHRTNLQRRMKAHAGRMVITEAMAIKVVLQNRNNIQV